MSSGKSTNAGGLIGRAQRAAELAAPIFAAAEWKWRSWDGHAVEPFVPDEEQIFTIVLKLLTEVRTDSTLSRGRFHVTKNYDPPHTVWSVALGLSDYWEDDEDA